MTKDRYLIEITITSDQNTSESTPSTLARITGMSCASPKVSRKA